MFIARDYSIKYKINNVNITETYIKKENKYKLSFKIKDKKYDYTINDRYTSKRRLITNIKAKKECLSWSFKKVDYELCKDKNNNYYLPYYNNKLNSNIIDKYKNIDIYEYNNNNFYIWNYNNILYLNNKKQESLKLFNHDEYELSYIIKIKDHLLIADYNENYIFNKFFLLNSSNNTYKEINLFQNLSIDGYFLGTFKNDVYLYDTKSQKEYKLNPFKEEIDKTSYGIYFDGKWVSIPQNKLDNKKALFIDNNNFYEIINNHLYYKNDLNNILVYNGKVDRIIESNNEEAYFFSNDKLIYNNYKNGNKLLMKYSEWEFNNKNIYIFNN